MTVLPMVHNKITFILGCTGCGKGAVSRALARRLGGEILSVDSMKVFRGMDIGTAKPDADAQSDVAYHLLDVANPWDDFSVAQYVQLAGRAIENIRNRGKAILAVGGTGLYIKALSEGLFEGPGADPNVRNRLHEEAKRLGQQVLHDRLGSVDPVAADRIHVNDLRRIVRALEVYELTGQPITTLQTQWDRNRTRYDCVFIGLRRQLEDANHRRNERVRRMIRAGLVDEVRALLALDRPLSRTARQALGYAEIIEYLQGKMSLEDATLDEVTLDEVTLDEVVERIKINTRHFAKSQRTWFKRFHQTHWFDLEPDSTVEEVADSINQFLRF